MRYVRLVLFLLGTGGLAFLIARIGPDALAAAFAEIRWWQFVLVCLPYGLIMVVDTLGWRYAFARVAAPFHRLLGARLAGDAVNVVTAMASVGGEAVKAPSCLHAARGCPAAHGRWPSRDPHPIPA
jgi:uncharacterized membrane protein YbhN (UPF0104 family)